MLINAQVAVKIPILATSHVFVRMVLIEINKIKFIVNLALKHAKLANSLTNA